MTYSRRTVLAGLGAVAASVPGGRGRAQEASRDVILTDATVVTMDDARRAFSSGYVWIRGTQIHRVGAMSGLGPVPGEATVRQLGGGLIMPGLINCHTHLSNAAVRGLYDEMPLDVWFSKGMWPVLEELDGEAGAAGAALSLLELMTGGVTTSVSGEFGTPRPDLPDGVLTAVTRSGMRAVVSRMTVDSADESSPSQFIPAPYRETPERAAEEVRRLQRAYASDRITVAPEALGVLRCTPAMIEAMHALAVDTDTPFLMHAASSPDELDESRRRFGHGSVAELERLGVLGPRTLLAHAVWLDNEEIDVLARRQTGISHNPVSNAYYASGIARLGAMLAAGVRVGLGTDGASTNNGQNVWETMKVAMLMQKEAQSDASFGSAELALELMTRGGAAALHMDDAIGSLEPGKRADLIVIDTDRVSLSPGQTLISNLVYSNDPGAVRDVYVDGELVVRDGVHRSLDRDAVIADATAAFDRILRKTGLDSYIRDRTTWDWDDG